MTKGWNLSLSHCGQILYLLSQQGSPYTYTHKWVYIYIYSKRKRAFLVAQIIWSLPAVLETLVQSQDWEDPLEKEMATYFTIFT